MTCSSAFGPAANVWVQLQSWCRQRAVFAFKTPRVNWFEFVFPRKIFTWESIRGKRWTGVGASSSHFKEATLPHTPAHTHGRTHAHTCFYEKQHVQHNFRNGFAESERGEGGGAAIRAHGATSEKSNRVRPGRTQRPRPMFDPKCGWLRQSSQRPSGDHQLGGG